MNQKHEAPAIGQGAQNFNKDTKFPAYIQQPERLPITGMFTELNEDITKNIERLENVKHAGMFRIRKGNVRMTDARNMPIPRDLYMSLIYQNEITILFADTGIGKTIFAMQIAVEISKLGETVTYLDLELSDKQFEKRYSTNYQNPYTFSNNIYFIDFAESYSIPEGSNYDNEFIVSLINAIELTGSKVIIIDNMTKLVSCDTDKAQTAKPLMDRLKDIQRKYGLTMLLLEHTRKTDGYRPISINDLQGSKMKVNFADAVFSIGRSSKDHSIRYIKQLKCRSSEIVYHEENVAVFEIAEKDSFLHFKPIGYSYEYEHLKQPEENNHSERKAKILELKKQGLSNTEIGRQLNISEGAVRKAIKRAGDIQ